MNDLKKIVFGLLPFLFGIIGVIFSLWGLGEVLKTTIKEDNRPDCKQEDVYKIGDWSECKKDGFQERNIEDFTGKLSCKNPGKVEKPDEKRSCNYIPKCEKNDWKISEWETCINGKQIIIIFY